MFVSSHIGGKTEVWPLSPAPAQNCSSNPAFSRHIFIADQKDDVRDGLTDCISALVVVAAAAVVDGSPAVTLTLDGS